jgi:hypothetical protein
MMRIVADYRPLGEDFTELTDKEAHMALQFRRVVTGHDANGRAIVKIDEIAKNQVSSRPGATAGVVWTTEGFPIDNTG